jgi:hypothetical protein
VTTTDLWRTLADLADAWRRTPALGRFARDLPENAPQRSKGLPGMLQHIHAGASGLISNPLLLATRLPMAASVVPDIDEQQLRAKHGDWLDAANRAEVAHRRTLAWLRARLPGYPNPPAPQLAPGAPLTTSEFTHRLIWQPGERGQQLHLRDVPPEITDVLLADGATARALMQATRTAAIAFADTPQWAALAAAADALDDTARADLRAARSGARKRLTADAADAHEPCLALPRAAYREHVIRDEIDALTGTARAYAEAFDAADDLVETAASSVFGQIACYPVRTMAAADLEIVPGTPTTVRYTTPDVMLDMPRPGAVAWLDDSLVPDAVRIDSVTLSFDETDQSSLDLTAEVLAGTATAWRG